MIPRPLPPPSHYNGVAPSSGTQTHARSTALEVTAKKGGPGHFETTAAAHLILVKENTKYVPTKYERYIIHISCRTPLLLHPRQTTLDSHQRDRLSPVFFLRRPALVDALALAVPSPPSPKNHDPSLKQDGLSSVGSMLLLWEAGTLVPSTDWEVLGRTT